MNEEIYYHIYNRGSDKRDIFIDKMDYERFLKGLKEYNTVINVDIRDLKSQNKGQTSGFTRRSDLCDLKLVEIMCYCLMPNHFHLVLRALLEDGIAKFIQKLGTGYAMYFNKKYDHSGHLFQGKYKSKEINADFYLTYLTGYIHLNPVVAKLVDLPEKYKYSSYLDYLGRKETDFLDFDKEILEIKMEDYEKFIMELKNNKELFEKVKSVDLED